MKSTPLNRNVTGLSRRDFLKIVSTTGGALAGGWLLAGCASQPETPPLPTPSLAPEPTGIPSNPPEATRTGEPTQTPEPSATATATPAPTAASDNLPPVAAGQQTISLPAPRTDGGLPLMQALLKRHSTRAFRQEEPGVQVLSDLLWAAFGVNRPETGGRTAPSAYNVRDVDIYLATAKGLYRYEAGNHSLTALLADDLRASTGTQSYVAGAPVNLVYVSDHGRMASFAAQDREQWSWAHSGLIAQNVYLFCASEGLVTVVRSTIDRERLAGRMGLNGNQHITLAQSLGYPTTG